MAPETLSTSSAPVPDGLILASLVEGEDSFELSVEYPEGFQRVRCYLEEFRLKVNTYRTESARVIEDFSNSQCTEARQLVARQVFSFPRGIDEDASRIYYAPGKVSGLIIKKPPGESSIASR